MDKSGGLTIYHGHGTVVNLYKAGTNLSVYQGVTIGNKGNGREVRSLLHLEIMFQFARMLLLSVELELEIMLSLVREVLSPKIFRTIALPMEIQQ